LSTPPKPGARPSVRVGQELSDDLAVIMSATGANLSDVIREAVRHMADAIRRAQDYGDVPEGTAPTILGAHYAEAAGQAPVGHSPAPASDSHRRQASDTQPAASDTGTNPSDTGPGTRAGGPPSSGAKTAASDAHPAMSDALRPTPAGPVGHRQTAVRHSAT